MRTLHKRFPYDRSAQIISFSRYWIFLTPFDPYRKNGWYQWNPSMASRKSSLVFQQMFNSVMHPSAKQLRWSSAKVQRTLTELRKVDLTRGQNQVEGWREDDEQEFPSSRLKSEGLRYWLEMISSEWGLKIHQQGFLANAERELRWYRSSDWSRSSTGRLMQDDSLEYFMHPQ